MDERKLADALIRHDLAARKLDQGEADKIVRLLNSAIDDAKSQLVQRHALAQSRGGLDKGPARTQFLKDEIEAYSAINEQVYGRIAQGLETSLVQRAAAEQDFTVKAGKSAGATVDRGFRPHDTNFLRTLVNNTPIPVDQHGAALLKPWVDGMAAGDLARFEAALRTGLVQGETTDQLAKRIEAGGWARSRQSAQTVALTANSAIANAARLETFKGMRSIAFVEWSAILDSRTSAICQGLSGQIWPIDGAHPTPPAHPRCRSLLLPRKNDTDAPLHQPYREWLKRQDTKTQDEVLGKRKGKLYRDGKLTDTELKAHDGSTATLDDLKAHDAAITETPKAFSPVNPATTAETVEVRSRKDVMRDLNQGLSAAKADARYDPRPEFRSIKPEDFGKAALSTSFTDEAASMIAALMPEVDAITDAFGVPRLRALKSGNGAYVANMGDGTLTMNPASFNRYAVDVGGGAANSEAAQKIVAAREALRAELTRMSDELAQERIRLRDLTGSEKETAAIAYLDKAKVFTAKRDEFIALDKKAFKLGVTNQGPKPQSTWKPGDPVASRPNNAFEYFEAPMDRARNVMYHETAHHVHQMLGKTVRRNLGAPPIERELKQMFFNKFHGAGPNRAYGLELKKLVSSTYATTDAFEWFAEGFSLFMQGRRDLVDTELVELIERLMKEKR